jgi:D-sedoheptulose 7-phosphate isomerase
MKPTHLQQNISSYFQTVARTLENLDLTAMESFVQTVIETREHNGTIYIFGNGGSGANASHICGDMIKGLAYGDDIRFKAICLNDNAAAMMAIANDISYDDIFLEQLKNFVVNGDLVIGISGSGNSENVVRALKFAKEQSATTVAMCGFNGGKIKMIADIVLHVNIDDMEISEDVHLILAHCAKRMIMDSLNIPCPYD